MTPLLITFSGIDGAGKSTQIEKLREYLTQQGLSVRILTFWDNVAVLSSLRSGFSRKVLQSDGQVGSPDKPANRNDKNTRSFPLLVGRSLLHLADVFRLRQIIRRERSAGNGGVIIFDRYIYDQLAALPMHHWLARAYARFVLSLAPNTDVSYLLDAVPEEARARKPEYPIDFMRQYRSSYLELRKFAPLSLISAGDPDNVHVAIVACLSAIVSKFPQPQVDSTVAA
ncbi:MAG: thymidylate kinase [Acidobacteriaceae bacterium]|nr:thymidylate kinase [Acidobacteriaceae bacterium]